jgi:hypothetical protein
VEILFLLEGIRGRGSDKLQAAGLHACSMWYSDSGMKNEPVLNKWPSLWEVRKL